MDILKGTQNENIAMMATGIEGTGEHFVMGATDTAKIREEQSKFNTQVDEYVDRFNKHGEVLEEYAKKISDEMSGLEIMPGAAYVLIKPFEQNPFQQIKVSKTGIITDLGGLAPIYKSNETGEIEEEQQVIKVGSVVETGYKCEFVKPGDVVFYSIYTETMVPFFKQGFITVAENRIIAIVNDDLTSRKHNIQNGR